MNCWFLFYFWLIQRSTFRIYYFCYWNALISESFTLAFVILNFFPLIVLLLNVIFNPVFISDSWKHFRLWIWSGQNSSSEHTFDVEWTGFILRTHIWFEVSRTHSESTHMMWNDHDSPWEDIYLSSFEIIS